MDKVHSDINKAADLIKAGRLVAFPTDTVYGLGANALDPDAVAKIFELKQRPSFDPLIVHISDMEMLEKLSSVDDRRVQELADAFWPGPLTIVLPKSDIVPDIVTSGLETVGIRMPDNEMALDLIRLSTCPIAAPSANSFGKISPTKAQHVLEKLPGVDYVLDGGAVKLGIESTIIQLDEKGFRILRPGIITKEEIEAVLPYSDVNSDGSIIAPGMVKSHYSPDIPMQLVDDSSGISLDNRENAAYIPFGDTDLTGFHIVKVLSESMDLKEYAVNMFASWHELQKYDIDRIFVQRLPEEGIGIAIMDRMRKAAYRHGGI